jgi:hypothetical protein
MYENLMVLLADRTGLVTDPMSVVTKGELAMTITSWTPGCNPSEYKTSYYDFSKDVMGRLKILADALVNKDPVASVYSIHPQMALVPLLFWYSKRMVGSLPTVVGRDINYIASFTYDVCDIFYQNMILTYQMRTSFDVQDAYTILTGDQRLYTADAAIGVVDRIQQT